MCRKPAQPFFFVNNSNKVSSSGKIHSKKTAEPFVYNASMGAVHTHVLYRHIRNDGSEAKKAFHVVSWLIGG